MKLNFKKVVSFTIELLISPFILLFRTANVIPNPNKIVKPIILLLISVTIVALIVLYVYRGVIFK
ncbi:MAG: hypothetical protein IKP77_05940 [Acholeplasmatales bacterium]|nr:hypothetical protein [Acholeplasmatales bacterium]